MYWTFHLHRYLLETFVVTIIITLAIQTHMVKSIEIYHDRRHLQSTFKSQKSFQSLNTKDATNWYYDKWCGQGDLHYLDDADCVKVFPSSSSSKRDWYCPNLASNSTEESLIEVGYFPDTSLSKVTIDTSTLGTIVTTDDVNACIILTKRIKSATSSSSSSSSTLYNKYFCLGEDSKSSSYETWSSSKIFAMANAAGHLRSNESICMDTVYGMDSTTSGKHGITPLGDLATIVCSYDTTAGYSSNSLSSYFHDIGWRDHIHTLVTSDWLGLPNHTLGGNYGESSPSDLKLTFTASSSQNTTKTCSADKDSWETVYSNTISVLAAAEMARRIVLHDDIDDTLKFPGLTSVDAKQIMLGEENSILFPGATWGGMSVDTAVFVQSGLNMTNIEERSDGNWRIFSKLGAGYSNSRYRGEIITTAYACLPVLGDSSSSSSGDYTEEGVEFTVSVRGSVPFDYTLEEVETKVAQTVKAIVGGVMNGKIQ